MNKKIISIKLLSEVLKKDVKKIYKLGSNPNFSKNDLLYSIWNNGDLYFINIYELGNKCKKWAEKQGFVLSSSEYNGEGFCEIKRITAGRLVSQPWVEEGTYYSTELEAILEACEWILNNQALKGNISEFNL